MSMNDTISDLLTRIRNAYRAAHEDVACMYSVMNERIVDIMTKEGYLTGYEVVGEGVDRRIIVKMKYVDGDSVITGLQRQSKPSCRRYVGYSEIKPIMNGLGISILSTPAGVLSDKDARKNRVGGEVLCSVW